MMNVDTKTYYIGLNNRDIVSYHSPRDTWLSLPRQPTLVWDDSFCRIVRDTDDIRVDELIMNRNRREHEHLLAMAEALGREIKPDEMMLAEILNLVVMFNMVQAGARMERALNRMLWAGTEANRVKNGWYREFNGFDLLIGPGIDAIPDEVDRLLSDWLNVPQAEGIDYILAAHPNLLTYLGWDTDTYAAGDRSFPLVADYGVLCLLGTGGIESSSVYVIPTVRGDAPLTYIEYADYRHILTTGEKDYFWSDEGLYIWRMQNEKWDARLSVKNESKLVVKQPELAMKITLKYPIPEVIV